jgi:hypothetical protein
MGLVGVGLGGRCGCSRYGACRDAVTPTMRHGPWISPDSNGWPATKGARRLNTTTQKTAYHDPPGTSASALWPASPLGVRSQKCELSSSRFDERRLRPLDLLIPMYRRRPVPSGAGRRRDREVV